MKYLILKRKDGSVNTVRYECETAGESSLTLHEEIIIELYRKNEELEAEKVELTEFVNKAEQFLGPYTNARINQGELYAMASALKYKLQKEN